MVCTDIDVTYDVSGGTSGSVTYVEGTTSCSAATLSGAATQTVSVNFVTCAVTPDQVTAVFIKFYFFNSISSILFPQLFFFNSIS